jgi:phage gp36-like protein
VSYATKSNLEQVFGSTNVEKWADLDNDGDETNIAARIAAALDWADNEIDSLLRESRYDVPITPLTGSATPPVIRDVAASLAGVWLYEARGVQDYNPDTGAAVHRLEWHRRRAHDTLSDIVRGKRRIDAVLVDDVTYLQVVEEDDE